MAYSGDAEGASEGVDLGLTVILIIKNQLFLL
jgi:hypothetical protein